MNRAMLSNWAAEQADILVAWGVPRAKADATMETAALAAEFHETSERNDRQFLLDLKTIGTAEMARRRGVSAQAIRKARQTILNSQPTVALPVAP